MDEQQKHGAAGVKVEAPAQPVWCYAHGGPMGSAGQRCVCGRAAGVQASPLSEFIRNATPERKTEVFGRVMDKVTEQQQAVIDGAAGVKEVPHG